MVSEPSLANTFVNLMASIAESSSSSAAFHLPSQVISIKLDGTNFLAWSAQLLPLFRSYGLMGIADGSEPSPPQFSSTENKTQCILNSAFVVWQYKDQTVLGWIVSSLSPAAISTIYGLETSRLVWQALGAQFAAPSTSCISLIKRKLQSVQQGSMSCQDFFDEVKSLANELSAVGKPIDDSDLILSVLNGLNSSFHSFKFHSQTIQPEAGPYALYSHKPGSKPGFRNSNSRSCFSSVSKGSGGSFSHFQQQLPHLPSSSPVSVAARLSLGLPVKYANGKVIRQDCFNRMNYLFHGRADSGANIHVTSNIANLATSQPYDGDDSVGVGNGTGLVISRTGTASIQTSSSTLKLNDIAYCPQASAHLLSINKFCKDNNVRVELTGSCFSMKDILTGNTILTGPSDNGLYPINLRQLSSPKFHAFTMTVGVKASTSTWHSRDQSLFSAPACCVASLLARDQPPDSACCVASLPARDQPLDSARCVTSSPARVKSIFTYSARCVD
ncbi:hypothetical protein Patl1_29917 [Pistacia atlantica]|uniref:Uncharacterized protein n=1 Tax=Pistacia atlantica TaxID=434234 RepID=A0ACC1ABY7_9ROSI|nr:hypothetical protein Patl1_29917 [Pistacia atlantica]